VRGGSENSQTRQRVRKTGADRLWSPNSCVPQLGELIEQVTEREEKHFDSRNIVSFVETRPVDYGLVEVMALQFANKTPGGAGKMTVRADRCACMRAQHDQRLQEHVHESEKGPWGTQKCVLTV